MSHDPGPFESIESAHDFLGLFCDAVVEAKQAIDANLQAESNADTPRRMDALRLALYKLEKLEFYFHKSVRILNDLRSLRRLLFEERAAARALAAPNEITGQQVPPVGSGERHCRLIRSGGPFGRGSHAASQSRLSRFPFSTRIFRRRYRVAAGQRPRPPRLNTPSGITSISSSTMTLTCKLPLPRR